MSPTCPSLFEVGPLGMNKANEMLSSWAKTQVSINIGSVAMGGALQMEPTRPKT